MTVPYRPPFYRLVFKWKGSLYKAVCFPLLAYTIVYLAVALIITAAVKDENNLIVLRRIQRYGNYIIENVPLSFILGFFVYLIVDRWWSQYYYIPMCERFMFMISSSIRDNSARAKEIRLTLARWWNLYAVLGFATISEAVLKRFPTHKHLVMAQLMNEKEMVEMERCSNRFGNYFVPIAWMMSLLKDALHESLITEREYCCMIRELMTLRDNVDHLCSFDWIPIPLVYTQVCTLATYLYFFLAVMAFQIIPEAEKPMTLNSTMSTIITNAVIDPQEGNYLFPLMGVAQFLFYYGLLQVASDLMDPFGEDDDDYELNFLVDRNITTSYFIVQTLHAADHPPISTMYPDHENNLIHTHASLKAIHEPFRGHLKNLSMTNDDQMVVDVGSPKTSAESGGDKDHNETA